MAERKRKKKTDSDDGKKESRGKMGKKEKEGVG